MLVRMAQAGTHNPSDILRATAWRLHHQDAAVRHTAVEALAEFATEDCQNEAVTVVMEYLDEGCSSETRTTALSVLGKIAHKGDAQVLQALSRQLLDRDYRVVRQALAVIEELARFDGT